MTEPAWAKILDTIYHQGEQFEVPKGLELPNDHELIQKTGLSQDEFRDGLIFLRDQEVIEMSTFHVRDEEGEKTGEVKRNIQLKPAGFEVAHDREVQTRQAESNTAVALFTAVLALTAMVEILIAYAGSELPALDTTLLGLIILLISGALGAAVGYLWNAGVIKPN